MLLLRVYIGGTKVPTATVFFYLISIKFAPETSFLHQLSTEKLSDLLEKPYLCRLTYHTSIICNVNLNKTQP